MQKKCKVIIFSFLFLIIGVNCAASIYKKPRRVYVIKSVHFDFIFPAAQRDLAYKIASFADGVFDEAVDYFSLQDMKKAFRIPCAISCDSESLSVKYTSAPYNRIVIFASAGDGTAVSDTLLTEFRRAVSEAVSSSVRTATWQKINNTFNMDTLQPIALLNIPSNFLEGVVDKYVYDVDNMTSGFEVLEDGDALSLLTESKAAGGLPSYRDAMGARDIYGKSLERALYSAFVCYTISRWGLDRFLEYWKCCGGLSYFKMASGIFFKVYGIKLKVAWSDFISAIPLSTREVFGNRLDSRNSFSTYSNISPCVDGVVYFDNIKNNIYKIQTKKLTKKEVALIGAGVGNQISDQPYYIPMKRYRKKLLSWASGVTSISTVGNIAAISYNTKKSNAKLNTDRTLLLNTSTGHYIHGRNSFKGAVISDKYLAGYNSQDNSVTLEVHLLKRNKKGRIKGVSKKSVITYPLPAGSNTYNIIWLGGDEILFIYYYNGECVLSAIDVERRLLTRKTLNLSARDFKAARIAGNTAVTFSYLPRYNFDGTIRNSDPIPARRVGYIEVASGKVYLGEDDFSGGIYSPLVVDGNIVFSRHIGSGEELRVGDFSALKFSFYGTLTSSIGRAKSSEREVANAVLSDGFNARLLKGAPFRSGSYKEKNYNPLKYMNKFSITPFSPITQLGIIKNSTPIGLGLHVRTSRDILDLLDFELSGTWGYLDYDEYNHPFYDTNWVLAFIVNSTYLPVDLSLGVLWSFSNEGSYNLCAMFSTAYNIFCGMSIHKLAITTNLLWDCTTEYKDYERLEVIQYTGFPNPLNMYNTMKYSVGVTYDNYHQSGRSAFEERGFELSIHLINIVDPQKSEKIEDYENQLTMMFTAGMKFPFLIPVFNTGNFVVCLPTSFYARFYGEDESALEYRSETLVFGYELQKAFPGLPIYIQRFGLYFGYDCNINNNYLINAAVDFKNLKTFFSMYYLASFSDYFFIKATATLSPNIGKFTGKQITAGAEFCFDAKSGKFFVNAVFETKF